VRILCDAPCVTETGEHEVPQLRLSVAANKGGTFMGVIDKCSYTLTCSKCGASSSASIVEYGSNWRSSGWGNRPIFTGFSIEWHEDVNKEPVIKSARCEKCCIAASVA
jgi:hypothetical protein